jgi:hypothetical protein
MRLMVSSGGGAMSNPRPPQPDPDPFQARQTYHITARVFDAPAHEIGRLNYRRHGADELGTLVAHLAYINAQFYCVDLYITNRPTSDKTPGKRTDELPDEDSGPHTSGRLPIVP